MNEDIFSRCRGLLTFLLPEEGVEIEVTIHRKRKSEFSTISDETVLAVSPDKLRKIIYAALNGSQFQERVGEAAEKATSLEIPFGGFSK